VRYSTPSRRVFLRSLVAMGGVGALHGVGLALGQGLADEAWLEVAEEGINQHRRGPGTVRVVETERGCGLPGVEVEVEQIRHHFLFGANCFMWRTHDPVLREAYRRRFACLLNAATLHFFWASYEPRRGQPRHELMDEQVAWCLAHGIVGKGCPLVWANFTHPAWLPAGTQEIQEVSLGRVRDIVGRFRGRIDLWDVVNEPSLLMWAENRYGAWAQSIGTQSFVRRHLEAAREANPDATLLVNEVLTPYPAYALLDSLRDQSGRTLYDAVGIQSHMHLGLWSPRYVAAVCEKFGNLGVPVHFSEVTVLSGARGDPRGLNLPAVQGAPGENTRRTASAPAQGKDGGWDPTSFEYEVMQAEYVPRLYTQLFGHPAVAAITWWDLTDRGAWKGAAAGLLRADMSPKPVYERLLDLIKRRWWTRMRGETNHDGELFLRPFYGRHRITARHRDGREVTRECEWLPRGEPMIEVVLAAG